jgi:hypothetical protein
MVQEFPPAQLPVEIRRGEGGGRLVAPASLPASFDLLSRHGPQACAERTLSISTRRIKSRLTNKSNLQVRACDLHVATPKSSDAGKDAGAT